jgi:hypothetical protein
VSKLPRWVCLNDRDAEKLIEWTNRELDRLETVRGYFLEVGNGVEFEGDEDPSYIRWRKEQAIQQAIEQADNGNIKPLRHELPHLARFLHLGKRKRGQRYAKAKEGDPLWEATLDVRIIRHLWKKHYKKINRPKNDRVTAEQIAADRWKVDVEAVVSRLKKTSSK